MVNLFVPGNNRISTTSSEASLDNFGLIIILLIDQLQYNLAALHIQGIETAVLHLIVEHLIADADKYARWPRYVDAALVRLVEDVRAAARIFRMHAPIVA